MENIAEPTLLSKALAFVCKSAVVVIAPLALASVAHAAAQTTFSVPGAAGTGSITLSGSGGGTFLNGGINASQLTLLNSILGVKVAQTGTFTSMAGGSGNFSMPITTGGTITGSTLAQGTSILTTYDFTLSTSRPGAVTTWTLYSGINNSTTSTIASGTGTGSFSGSVNLITGATTPSSFAPYLEVNLDGVATDDTFTVTMAGAQGISFNTSAIPEPSTYALLAGLGALGLVTVRRLRRRTAA